MIEIISFKKIILATFFMFYALPVSSAVSPIGVMGAHTHQQGSWMLSYRFMRMEMDGNRTGTSEVSTPLPNFMVSPLNMTMDMHMLGGMFAPSEDLTLMFMVPVLDIAMNHRITMGAMSGVEFTTEADGIGDIRASLIFDISSSDADTWLLSLGLGLPTGSIDEKDVTPATAPNTTQLPYPMQIGSGTYDLFPSVTWLRFMDTNEVGAQATATLRLGENDNGYTLGNRLLLTSWYSHAIDDKLAASVRVAAETWGNIDGADKELAAAPTVPTKNTNLRGGTRADLLFGLSWTHGHHHKSHQLAAEIGVPFYQKLDGPQLETDLQFILGWKGTY